MEDFNSDERFLVPDSEDDDLNSREPWDLISGLEALTSLKRFRQTPSDSGVHRTQNMSSPHKKENKVFPSFDANESADDTKAKKVALAYDTISDVDSGDSSHNHTVIERKPSKKHGSGNPTSTPSETISSLQFSQDVILVPETLDSLDVVGPSPKTHTAPFVVPDSPSQEEENDGEKDADITFKATSSSSNSQGYSKIDSQGLHLHFSQSQLDSSEPPGSIEQTEAMFGDRGLVTTPVKEPAVSLSCRKLSLKDAPPSPQRKGESLPRSSFHVPSKLLLPSISDEDETVEKQTACLTEKLFQAHEESKSKSKKKQMKKQRLFMDTEEEASTKEQKAVKSFLDTDEGEQAKDGEGDCLDANKNVTAGDCVSQPQPVASLVLTEEPESVMMDVDQTISYEYMQSHDQSLNGKVKETSVGGQGECETTKPAVRSTKRKEDSQSQAEFDGFDDEDVETLDHKLMQNVEKDEHDKSNRDARDDSPVAPSSQVNLPGESKSINHAPGEVSNVTESLNPDPYQFQGSQTQNFADVSNQYQPPTDKSVSVDKPGGRTKTVKVMRKVLKKKLPLKKDQKSSSTDESISIKPVRSTVLRKKMPLVKSKSKSNSTDKGMNSKTGAGQQQDAAEPTESFTTIQSKMCRVSDAGSTVPTSSIVSCTASTSTSNVMPPPVARMDVSRKSALASNETSPLDINKLSKKSTTVSFQEEFMPKAAKETPELFGEIERKTVREFKAIVVEKETTIDILDDKGNILKQTVTKEVTRTPIEPPWLSVSVQVTERIISPNVSPSRSVSTLTSGDLADVSSSSLSRSISSGSKGSNPSLEFCSQSYPTPAQRSSPLESESNKARGAVVGTATTAGRIIPSAPATQDSKRLSSGSNTGQDLFGSPDMSLISHCTSGHLDRPVASLDAEMVLSTAVRNQAMETDEKDNKKSDNDTSRKTIETVDERETTLARGVDAESTFSGVLTVASMSEKGRGKRKMEERTESKNNVKFGKRLRQDDDKEQQDESVEMSGSSVSTGFVVQEFVPTACDKAATSKSTFDDGQKSPTTKEPVNVSVDGEVTLEIKSRLLVGEQVMGKWSDGCYYPGVIKKLDSTNTRYQVKFDDSSQKWVGPEGLLLAKELPVGQSVMVLNDEDYYICGMVMAHSWTSSNSDKVQNGDGKTLIYHVERDDGVTQKCPRKSLSLSEDQAACLMSDHDLVLPCDVLPTMTPKKGDISLDNLVEGKRHRAKDDKASGNDSVASGRKSAKAVGGGGEETPTPSLEGGATRSSRKRKVGPVATSTPTPKISTSTAPHDRGTPLKPSSDRLGSVVSSPSVSRKSPRTTRQDLFGKKLSPSSDLFKDLTFLLTHLDKSVEQRQEEKNLLGDSSLEDTSMDDNGEHGSSQETNPFVKDKLHSLILAGGGKVLDKMDVKEIQEAGLSKCYLVASEHQRTIKYLQALASNIKIVSHQWILHSIDQGRLLGLKAFLLPAGISLEKRKLMECKNVNSHLLGLTMLIVSSRDEFVEAWSSILSLAKCHLPTKFPARAIKADPGIDYVISDTTCPAGIVRKCRQLDVPLVSSEWVAQCLINNTLIEPSSHDKFKHDYDS